MGVGFVPALVTPAAVVDKPEEKTSLPLVHSLSLSSALTARFGIGSHFG
jgi:hypothetical protein